MTEMLEKIARAVCEAQGLPYHPKHLKTARAAVEAMREPNDKMLKPMIPFMTRTMARRVHFGIIDAILKEESGPVEVQSE